MNKSLARVIKKRHPDIDLTLAKMQESAKIVSKGRRARIAHERLSKQADRAAQLLALRNREKKESEKQKDALS